MKVTVTNTGTAAMAAAARQAASARPGCEQEAGPILAHDPGRILDDVARWLVTEKGLTAAEVLSWTAPGPVPPAYEALAARMAALS